MLGPWRSPNQRDGKAGSMVCGHGSDSRIDEGTILEMICDGRDIR